MIMQKELACHTKTRFVMKSTNRSVSDFSLHVQRNYTIHAVLTASVFFGSFAIAQNSDNDKFARAVIIAGIVLSFVLLFLASSFSWIAENWNRTSTPSSGPMLTSVSFALLVTLTLIAYFVTITVLYFTIVD